MNFTTQQLVGGPVWSSKVRIGNWSEDEARLALAARDYEIRRSKGDLLHLKRKQREVFQTQSVPHSYSRDGLIRFGDTLQLSIELESQRFFLATNVFMPIQPGHCRVTASTTKDAVARNTFVVMRPKSVPNGDDRTPLSYGQKVYLGCNPVLVVDADTNTMGLPYLLTSQKANHLTGTGKKGRQEVTMCTTACTDAEWLLVHHTGDRLLTDGQPVRVGEPLQLVHVMSNQALAANTADTFPTDFGVELDVQANTVRPARHISMTYTGDGVIMPAEPVNRWTFVASSDPSTAADTRGFKPLTPETLYERARVQIAKLAGPHGVRSLALALAALDQRGNGSIPREAAKWALFEHGVKQPEDAFRVMLDDLETASGKAAGARGFILSSVLMGKIRAGSLNAARAETVEAAYHSACRRAGAGSGLPSIGALRQVYDAKWDPRVQAGLLTAVEASGEFGRQWPGHADPRAPVSLTEFTLYYEDVSPTVVSDMEFNMLVANLWHVPGRGCWKGKRAKRVQVSFHKGTNDTIDIPQAEDIPDDDFDGLANALRKMGYSGIARVTVLGLVDLDD